MTYQRMRSRNGILRRKPDDDPDPYFRGDLADSRYGALIGDLNRMERDYLNPAYPERPFAQREHASDPLSQVSAATGVDIEDARRVLRYVFMEQT